LRGWEDIFKLVKKTLDLIAVGEFKEPLGCVQRPDTCD
jgi:hypothetical protein